MINQCFRGKYSTPRGVRWLSVRAMNKETATIMLRNKTPWRAGWSLEEVVCLTGTKLR